MASSVYMSCGSACRGRQRWCESFIETSGIIFGLSIDHSCFTSVTFELPILPEDIECTINLSAFKVIFSSYFAKIILYTYTEKKNFFVNLPESIFLVN